MKVLVEDQKPCKKVLKISLPSEELKGAHKGILSEFQNHSRIPGFRQGKAPVKLVETKFAQDIKSEVLKKLLPKACREALESEKIQAVSDPVVDQINYDLEKGISFQAVVDIFPKVQLPTYKKLHLEKDPAVVEESDVERVISQLQEQHAVFQPIVGRALNYADYATLDYQTLDEKGKKLEQKNALIAIKEKEQEGFSDQLIGMEPDQTREVILEATKDHPELKFRVKLNAIKEKKLPDLDEEFLKTLGDVKDFEELRKKIREDLKHHKESAAEDALRNKAVHAISDQADFDIPQTQVRQETERIYSELIQNVKQGVIPAKSLEDEKMRQNIETEAQRRVRSTYIIHEVGLKEGLKVSDEELDQEIARMAGRLGKTVEELRSNLEKSERLDALRSRLLQDKVIDFIVQNAIIGGIIK